MTALDEFPAVRQDQRASRPVEADTGPAVVRGPVPATDRSGAVQDHAKTIRSWPLLVLAVPAAAEVWSGWVGIAQKTGFGMVPLLPGIWSSLHLDTAVTLPVGVECYAAYALRAWLATGHAISDRTRRFARRSAICSFALGMAGQIAFHLMDQDRITRAPWVITTLVSCLPVLVLGMGTALAHMLRGDAAAANSPGSGPPGPPGRQSPARSAQDQPADHPGPEGTRTASRTRTTRPARTTARTSPPPRPPSPAAPPNRSGTQGPDPRPRHNQQALRIARTLAAEGRPVSRRALRRNGVKGSNEKLNALARQLNAELAAGQRAPS